MRLADAAAYFDKTVCTDAYGAATFMAQLDLFDDSKRDGTTVARRVLSTADTVALPARRAIVVHGDTYIVGGAHPDSFKGGVIRRKYVCHKAEGLAQVRTADQALRALAGTDMYATRVWVKDMRELETSSRLVPFFDIFVAPTETVAVGAFVQLGGRWYVVRNTLLGTAGFLVLEGDELDPGCLAAGVYTPNGGVYDPASDSVTASANVNCNLLVHRWQDSYAYRHMVADRFEVGDVVGHVSKANVATARVGDRFTFAGSGYRVIGVSDDGAGAWNLHARRD